MVERRRLASIGDPEAVASSPLVGSRACRAQV